MDRGPRSRPVTFVGDRLPNWPSRGCWHRVSAANVRHASRNWTPAPYAPLERTFLRGWCRMVDYLEGAPTSTSAAWRVSAPASGLSIVRSIVAAHGGRLHVEAAEGGIPRRACAASTAPATTRTTSSPPRSCRVPGLNRWVDDTR